MVAPITCVDARDYCRPSCSSSCRSSEAAAWMSVAVVLVPLLGALVPSAAAVTSPARAALSYWEDGSGMPAVSEGGATDASWEHLDSQRGRLLHQLRESPSLAAVSNGRADEVSSKERRDDCQALLSPANHWPPGGAGSSSRIPTATLLRLIKRVCMNTPNGPPAAQQGARPPGPEPGPMTSEPHSQGRYRPKPEPRQRSTGSNSQRPPKPRAAGLRNKGPQHQRPPGPKQEARPKATGPHVQEHQRPRDTRQGGVGPHGQGPPSPRPHPRPNALGPQLQEPAQRTGAKPRSKEIKLMKRKQIAARPNPCKPVMDASWPIFPVRNVPQGHGSGTCVVVLGALTRVTDAAPYNQGSLAELNALGPVRLYFVGGRLQMRKKVPAHCSAAFSMEGFEQRGPYVVRSLMQSEMSDLVQKAVTGVPLAKMEVIEEATYEHLWETGCLPRYRACRQKLGIRNEVLNRFTRFKASHSISTMSRMVARESCEHVVVFRTDFRFPPGINITDWLLSDRAGLFSVGGAALSIAAGSRSDLFFGSRQTLSRLDGFADFLWTTGCPVDPDLRHCADVRDPCYTEDLSMAFEAQFGQYLRNQGIRLVVVPVGTGGVLRD